LHGKTKDEWYEEIAKRVANGDGPCAPPEYAEFRGPGVHHNYEDSDSSYDMDGGENKSKSYGADDTEMFENADEDKDLESQVSKTAAASDKDEPKTDAATEPTEAPKPAATTEGSTDAAQDKKDEETSDSKTE